MQILKNKAKMATITLVLMLTIATTFMVSLPVVNAANVQTFAFLNVNPNPIGVGQTLRINMWLQPFPPSGFTYYNYTLTITDPDGTIVTLGPFRTDVNGGAYTPYVPNKVGTWYFQFSFPGQTSAGNYYQAITSKKVALTVQQEPIPFWPAAPLPTDYWTRPIQTENREWYTIAGNWLGIPTQFGNQYNASAAFNPYTKAPNTAHIAWTREMQIGGLVGGDAGEIPFYAGLFYDFRLRPAVILAGKIFYNTNPQGAPSTLTGFECRDLRTGDLIWKQPTGTISCGQLLNFYGLSQAGGYIPYLWSFGSTYNMYDANTGTLITSFTGARTGTVTTDKIGSLLVYVLDSANGWFAMWNSTRAFIGTTSPASWRPTVGNVPWKNGVQWNVTYPKRTVSWNIITISDGVVMTRVGQGSVNTYNSFQPVDAKNGQLLWAAPVNITGVTTANNAAGDGIFVQYDASTLTYLAYDIHIGRSLWTSDPLVWPWGTYSGTANSPTFAYGKFYEAAFDGYVHCFDVKTGKELWKFSSGNSGYETIFGTWPSFSGQIVADGKVYWHTEEHTPPQPLWRGGRLFCNDADTGELVWSISGIMLQNAVADGYLVAFNAYDGRAYCFGKGQTATTVSAPQTAVANGSSVLIQGTVLDQSPGQPGTPCVSAKSMTAWMEYLHMQKSMPTNTTGVPVDLRAMRSDGTIIEIGTVTSDVSGHYAYKWTPPTPDTYKITATFNGDDSYGSSWAETGLAVGPTPAAPVPVPTKDEVASQVISQLPTFTTTDLAIIAAVVVAIVIGIVNLLMLRKRK